MSRVQVLLCVTAAVLFTFVGHIESKPFGDAFFCDLFCDDDDDYYDDPATTTTSTTTAFDDLLEALFDPCGACPTRRPVTPAPFNIVIPPSPIGVNVSMQNAGGSWLLNLLPWNNGAATPPAPASATTAAPPATTAAPPPPTTAAPPPTTAAPGATTAAPGATTAAPGATTAAPDATTAAPPTTAAP